MIIIIAFVILYLFYLIYKKFYFINVDNTLFLSGAPGTGKTNEAVKWALRLWRHQKRKVRWYNFKGKLFKRAPLEMPRLYSNIPVRVGRYSKRRYNKIINSLINDEMGLTESYLRSHISRTKFCFRLKPEHLMEQERLVLRSVVLATELGKMASQYHWSNENVQQHLDDFASMWRQYSKGGYFIADDQSSDNIVVQIRRRMGTVINMLHFRKFWKIYWVKMRNITISEDIKTVEEDSAEDNMRWRLSMFPLFHVNYDTYAFSERYNSVPRGADDLYVSYKTNQIIKLPEAKTIKYNGQTIVEGLLQSKLDTKDDFILTVDQDFIHQLIL